MRWRFAWLGLMVAGAAAAQPGRDQELAADEAVLRELRLPTKGAELLQILRDRTPTADTIAKSKQLVSRLKAAGFAERLKATGELIKMGPVSRPVLENLLLEIKADAETSSRLRHVLEQFPAEKEHTAIAAAARLIARDRPPGALATLLDFVPYATDESLRQEVQRSIDALALVDKKPAPILVEAIKSADPARRAAAGESLLRISAKDPVKPLLSDPHPLVRYQVGMTLVELHDKQGLSLLIQALPDLTPERAEYAIEWLERAAGNSAPDVHYRGKHTGAAVSAAWAKWLKKHDDLDLAKQFKQTDLGFTIISQTALKGKAKNQVFEIGPPPEQTLHWEFEGPRYALDLQILGPNRMLVAEYLDRRVTERDFKGNILKQFPANLPVGCQRLRNGETLIVTKQQLLIVDRDGKNVFAHTIQGILAARRLRNGQFAVATSGGRCQLLDKDGRMIKDFYMGGAVYTLGGNIEVLPNGRILAPIRTLNAVIEFDWEGNKHWQASVTSPVSLSRLPSGNTLVTCMDYRIVEIDRDGKEVWTYQTEGRPFCARRR